MVDIKRIGVGVVVTGTFVFASVNAWAGLPTLDAGNLAGTVSIVKNGAENLQGIGNITNKVGELNTIVGDAAASVSKFKEQYGDKIQEGVEAAQKAMERAEEAKTALAEYEQEVAAKKEAYQTIMDATAAQSGGGENAGQADGAQTAAAAQSQMQAAQMSGQAVSAGTMRQQVAGAQPIMKTQTQAMSSADRMYDDSAYAADGYVDGYVQASEVDGMAIAGRQTMTASGAVAGAQAVAGVGATAVARPAVAAASGTVMAADGTVLNAQPAAVEGAVAAEGTIAGGEVAAAETAEGATISGRQVGRKAFGRAATASGTVSAARPATAARAATGARQAVTASGTVSAARPATAARAATGARQAATASGTASAVRPATAARAATGARRAATASGTVSAARPATAARAATGARRAATVSGTVSAARPATAARAVSQASSTGVVSAAQPVAAKPATATPQRQQFRVSPVSTAAGKIERVSSATAKFSETMAFASASESAAGNSYVGDTYIVPMAQYCRIKPEDFIENEKTRNDCLEKIIREINADNSFDANLSQKDCQKMVYNAVVALMAEAANSKYEAANYSETLDEQDDLAADSTDVRGDLTVIAMSNYQTQLLLNRISMNFSSQIILDTVMQLCRTKKDVLGDSDLDEGDTADGE